MIHKRRWYQGGNPDMAAQPGVHRSASFSRFTDELFKHLPRADQRRWAHAYVQGLLTTSGKKTVRRMAAAVTDSSTAAQALHQFINASPWEWAPIHTELMQWAERRTRPRAWTIAPVVLPKRGEQSCGVHRRFVPHAGRTVNCQVGIGIFLSSDTGDVPIAWSMLLPEEWSDAERRQRARIPSDAMATAECVLDLANGLAQRAAHGPMPVVADVTGYLDTSALIHGLGERGHDFVVAVPDNLMVQPGSHLAARQCAEGAPVPSARFIAERVGHAPQSAGAPDGFRPYPTGLVYLPRGHAQPGLPRTYRLFAQPDDGQGRPGGLWLTNMTTQPLGELRALVDGQAATAAAVGRMERDFGLRDFEGRSYPGWHHHMTLISAAFTYDRLAAHQEVCHIGGFTPEHGTDSNEPGEPARPFHQQAPAPRYHHRAA
ncbi:IS701 family transposase [Streptomyces sp. NPDC002187]|uniref:IS701 family transposase n=1 Tax=Streptomyces sp. NPDC002187 TaxID=3364637 RepID=UPI0036A12456